MRNAVFYKGTWLMKGSKAYELYQLGEFSALDKHLKELDATYKRVTYG